jgi:hypothetical protein
VQGLVEREPVWERGWEMDSALEMDLDSGLEMASVCRGNGMGEFQRGIRIGLSLQDEQKMDRLKLKK